MLVNDGQAHRGFRKNIFNRVLGVVGIACGNHSSGGSIAQFEYAKGTLKEGEMPNINITVTDQVSEKLLQKMKTMGIDTNKIKFNVKKDNEKTDSGAAASRQRQFQVKSSTVEQATSKVRRELHKTKTSIVSKPGPSSIRPGLSIAQEKDQKSQSAATTASKPYSRMHSNFNTSVSTSKT